MDAAAKTVESLSQHILPERPHHLSYHTHWRYRPRPDEAASAPGSSGSGSRFEEWHNTRLQYMTLVSQADRGTLLTRSYYDMREEPPRPAPREVSALARSGADKKKLSLSDYKNKRTGAAATSSSSTSPPDPAVSKHRESERPAAAASSSAPAAPPDAAPAPDAPSAPADAAAAPSPTSAADAKPSTDPHKSTHDVKKPEIPKPHRPRPSSVDGKQRQPRDSPSLDLKLPPKLPSLPPKPPTPAAARKRVIDAEDESRPQKRPKADDRRPADRPTSLREDAHRRKERPQHNSRDAPSHRSKDDRPSSSSSLPNGRAILKGAAANSARNPSPGARPRGDLVNGIRTNMGGSRRSTPTKPDNSKSSVPPLLSPLHLSFDDHDRLRADDEDSSPRKDKTKKRDDTGEGGALPKSKKSETATAGKKSKPPIEIPPLLSPTLPPAVEAELRRRKKSPPESADDRSKDDRDGLGIKKRPAADNDDEAPNNKLGHRRRLVVVLSIPKGLRQSVKRILALPPGRKDAPGRERERAGSDEASQPTQARKRPVSATDVPAESLATKRPRTSDVAGLSRTVATPSTPSKKSTTMSRISSSNSLAQTPGETVSATPTAPAPFDRRPNGQDAPGWKPDRPEIKALVEKEDRLKRKGKSLKHDADLTMRSHRSPNASRTKPGESSKVKLGYVLSLESTIAFVMAFQAQNLWHSMLNKRNDHSCWISMFPLIEFLQNEMRGDELGNSQPLYALLLLLHAVCIDELLKCYANLDNASTLINVDGLLKLERKKARLWPMIRETNVTIANRELRADVTPWYSLDDITDSALRLLRRWCLEEKVDWMPEPMLRDYWPIKAGCA